MSFYNYNGKLFDSGKPAIGPDNRGLRYGDGLFETMKCTAGNIVLAEQHFERLWKGMELLQFDIPKKLTHESLHAEVIQLTEKNGHPNARIRIMVTRGNGGLYDTSNIPEYSIQTWTLPDGTTALNETGLHAGIFHDAVKTADRFANCKHNNFLPYVMGALFAKQNNLNDVILLNQHGRISDTTIANVFIVSKGNILTPSLPEGCVAGIIRRILIEQLPAAGMNVEETAITTDMLLDAEEVFLTNSIMNLKWIQQIDKKEYANTITKEISNIMITQNPLAFG
jgi:branched-chain amino acid aminotransferase